MGYFRNRFARAVETTLQLAVLAAIGVAYIAPLAAFAGADLNWFGPLSVS